jgi:hypothetical protein
MPTPTYIPLQTITLGSAASSVTFASIPQTYRDLVLVINGAMPNSGGEPYARLNSDSAVNYSAVRMTGEGSNVSSAAFTSNRLGFFFTYGSELANVIVSLMDYSATDKHKTTLSRGSQAAGRGVAAWLSRWANTDAVTSIAISHEGGDYPSGVTFSLYGIEA